MRELNADPDVVARRQRALEEAGKKISRRARETWADPAVRAKRVAGIRRAVGSDWIAALTPAELRLYQKFLRCGLGSARARAEIERIRSNDMEVGMETIWTEERLRELERLLTLNLSFAEIAQRMGLTKGQVIGKAHRLQIKRGERAEFASTYQPKRIAAHG